MLTVTVYGVTTHHPRSRIRRIAPRWATRSVIGSLDRDRLVAVLLIDTETEIDDADVNCDGMTEIGFNLPHGPEHLV